jgi:enterochelin esterase-like enzyme
MMIIFALWLGGCQPAASPTPLSLQPSATEKAIETPEQVVENVVATMEAELTMVATLGRSETATPTQIPTSVGCIEEKGQVVFNELESEFMPKPLVVRLYLPPCFDQGAQDNYPLIVLLHGQSFNDDQWDRLGVIEMADKLIMAGDSPPFIIAMPREEYYLQDPAETGFGEAIIYTLVPWLETNYAVCAERSCKAIGGISRGAAWAVRLGYIHWDMFGAIGGHSFPPFKNDIFNLPYWLKAFPAAERPALYLDIGIHDPYLRPNIDFHEKFIEYNVPHEWHLNVGGHEEIYWQEHVAEYMRWYTEPWQTQLLTAGRE